MPNSKQAPQVETSTKQAAGIVTRLSAQFADPRAITRREGWNPRFDFGEIEELAKSIKVNGILNHLRVKRIAPVDGSPFHFELIDGDRRLTAIELLLKSGHEFPQGIPVTIVDKKQDDLTSLIQMFEANSGKVFLPLEEAAAYKRMRDAGMTIKDICAKVGRKYPHVTETLAILDADDSVKEAVKDGSIGKTMAKQIASRAKGDKAKQKELVAAAKSAKKGGKGAVKDAIETVRRAKAKAKGKTLKMRALSDSQLSALGMQVAETLALMMAEYKKPLDMDMRAWIKKDDNLALAFTLGALDALKAAAGQEISLSI